MKSVFVDTNVLIYMRDASEPLKRSVATAWVERLVARGLVVISPQVLNEFVSVSLRRFDDALDDLETRVGFLATFCKVDLNARTTARALDLQRNRMISWWDAVLVASALDHGCELLLTEDLNDGQRIDGLRVVDPFTTSIDAVLRDV